MSKSEKIVKEAQRWRKKHGAEPLDFAKLDGALAQWETGAKTVADAQAAAKAAKQAHGADNTVIAAALKEAKLARKTKAAPKP